MSGFTPLRATRGRNVAGMLAMFATFVVVAFLSGCSLFTQQPPAPIVDLSTPQPASEVDLTEPEDEPASTPVTTQSSTEPRVVRPKPRRRVVAPRKPAPPPPVEEKPAPPPPPPPLLTTRILQHEQVHGLLDSEIQRPDGKVIGRAVDLFADASGKPKVMVVNLAGFLGVGDRKVTFPWTAFRFNPMVKQTHITLLPPPVAPGAKPKADAFVKPGAVNDIPPNLAQLIDSTLLQKNGAKMGRVIDVLIDGEAQPQALVVDLSDSLDGDKRQVAANWPDLHVMLRNKVLQLQMDFTDAQIKAAPTYSPEQPIKIVSPVVPAPESAPSAAAPTTAPATPGASDPAHPPK